MTSVLAEVEVPRALRRSGPAYLAAMPGVSRGSVGSRWTASVRATAGAYVTDALRSLEAIHLATAEVLVAAGKSVSAFVTYDRRQAARDRRRDPGGLPVGVRVGDVEYTRLAPPVCRSRRSASG